MSKYQSSYERIAKILAKKAGINLVIKGSGFSTDGKTIWLADIPDQLNEELRNPVLAGLLHETMHVRNSPFHNSKSKNFHRTELEKNYQGLLGDIEDCRMYSLGLKEYPGQKSLQKSGLEFMTNVLTPELPTIPSSSLLGIAIIYKYSKVDTSWLPEEINEIAEKTRDIWGPVKWKHGEENFKKQSIEVLKKIIDRLGDMQKQQQKNQNGKEENNEGESNNGNNETDTDRKDSNASRQSDQDKGNRSREEDNTEEEKDGSNSGNTSNIKAEEDKDMSKSDGDSGNEEVTGEENQSDSGQDENGEEIVGGSEDHVENILKEGISSFNEEKQSAMELLQSTIEKIINNFKIDNDKHIPHPEAIKLDKEIPFDNPEKQFEKMAAYSILERIKEMNEQYKKIEGKLDNETRKLKAKVLPLLMAQKRSSHLFEQTEGEIDDARIYKIRKGDDKIYKRKVPGRDINTAIEILNDVSGSMHGEKIKMLKATILVCGDALHSLKIPFEATGYTVGEYISQQVAAERYKLGSNFYYNRISPLKHYIFKDFNKTWISSRKNILKIAAHNTNCDNESIWWAAQRLLERKEERKILMILSDGMPNLSEGDNSLLHKDLHEKVKKIESLDVEILGIGILTSTPRQFYKTFIEINSVDEIASKVYQGLLEKLSQRFRRAV